ncbi:tumor necrosis factor receptor superfamily member 8 isoform X3 [Neoarius graeffei]|nr:tumor necrosis factor receptor superfamily member 8 isoform X3 [Neoarius graeffei]XP_060777965.1 tumor necrosis factor receptor superfamily member 8 isoform X3 [Neoarius graeffei]XP_060777966.1 tumor necrosis factor receptor superfamily member 8 isoform X3 [Neoarius graeffei]XP_060777967.1 tumor necrosis factor receptor superfamily member 8 isoform X3 [Neoarius graeffei]
MLMLCCGFLFLTHFICHANPRKCSQYQNEDRCKKCEPGERMESRCTDSCPTLCVQCPSDYYMDEPSYEMVCKRCTQCSKEHMVYKVSCSKSTDAVCDCESGYKCNGMPCTTCEKIPTTAPPTTPAPTTTTTTTAPTTASSSTVTCTRKRNEHPISPSQDPHVHVDGSCWLQLVHFWGPRKHLPTPVNAQRTRKCRCQCRKCVGINCGKKRFEGDRRKRRERGKKRHISVWIDYTL